MAGGPISIESAEIPAFLAKQKSLQLATLDPDGWPHLATMWFGLADGEIVMWTQKTSRKARNLRNDQRVACLVDEGTVYSELRGLSVQGRAELVEDEDGLLRIGEALITRNYAEDGRPDWRAMALSGTRLGLIVHAERTASWDFVGRTRPSA